MEREIETDDAVLGHGGVLVELPLEEADFDLEKAVCSHGLFMMAPNHWDSHSKTLRRPLRLDDDDDETSYTVYISHPPHALCLRVFGTDSLSSQQLHSLLDQVRRMLRLSVEENMRVKEFHEVHEIAKGRGFGRVFRSPTLFEDMIKCILLCNCQWSRTLSMAQALCELQLELQHPLSRASVLKNANGTISRCQTTEMKQFIPKTPAGKESKKKFGVCKCSINLASQYTEDLPLEGTDMKISRAEVSECSTDKQSPNFQSSDVKNDFLKKRKTDSTFFCYPQTLEGTERYPLTNIGNFPSPRELASLDETFLAKRCNLGYRARRIINLAREVLEERIQLKELENACGTLCLPDYNELVEKLRVINGFGPFTCANVLVCMGFYHVIPTDSETIRHLEQVHGKRSTMRTVQEDVEAIYGKYAPFQFLAYWSEVWNFYEEWFGKLSEMPQSQYRLITAANMRQKTNGKSKRMKSSLKRNEP